MQTDDDLEVTTEVDAEGYRIDHRSETEQSSQTKEVHEYADRTEIRLRDEKEVRLEELKSKETTRPATYDEILALLEAEYDGLEQVQTREVTMEEFSRHETTHEMVTDGEMKREVRIKDERRKEEVIEGPWESKREVVTETETTVVSPEQETPRSLPSGHVTGVPSVVVVGNPGAGSIGGDISVTVPAVGVGGDVRVKSEDVTLGLPAKIQSEPPSIVKDTDSTRLDVHGEGRYPEGTGSLHRIQHRKHVLEEYIVEDIDTFFEDQSKPAKKKLKKKDKTDGKMTPEIAVGIGTREPVVSEEKVVIGVPVPSGVITSPKAEVSVKSDLGDVGVKPRDVIVSSGQPPGDPNSVTYVVNYDFKGDVKPKEGKRRKKDLHPKKKKQKQGVSVDQPGDGRSVTYIVNYEPSPALDGEKHEAKIKVPKEPEVKLPGKSIPIPEEVKIEVDMNAGEVKVKEPKAGSGGLPAVSKAFVVETPSVEVSPAKPGKLKGEDDDLTFVVNYDLSGAVDASGKSGAAPKVDLESTGNAPIYSITVLEGEKTRRSTKKKKVPTATLR